ncbi:hypothetical protein [uncultured Deefgea sp.]|nr:hypothetical protein [uncultured Deefgea sp.]
MIKSFLVSGNKNGSFHSEIFTGYTIHDAEMAAYNAGYAAGIKIKEL